MTAKLILTFTDDLLKAIRRQGAVKLSLGGGPAPAPRARAAARGERGGGRPRAAAGGYREGSHLATISTWSQKQSKPFSTADAQKVAKVSRAHASMLLSRLVKDGALKRAGRGAYYAPGSAAAAAAAAKGPKPERQRAGLGRRAKAAPAGAYRPGSHPARLLQFARGRKTPFGVTETMKLLKVSRAHASMVLTKLVKDGSIKREGRGAYRAA
jgi:hypothetical protein